MCIATRYPIHIGSGASSPAILRRAPLRSPLCDRLASSQRLLQVLQHHKLLSNRLASANACFGASSTAPIVSGLSSCEPPRLPAGTYHRLSRSNSSLVSVVRRHQTQRWRTRRSQNSWVPAAPPPAFSMQEALAITLKSPSQVHTSTMETLPISMNGCSEPDSV